MTLLGAPAGASASATTRLETCHGLPATITGTPDQVAYGTEGDDVIVTAGSPRVLALGGDDTICVTGESTSISTVEAGAGDDLVDGTAATFWVVANLGTGTDTFLGGPQNDHVDARAADVATDTVSTAGGRDLVQVGTVGQAYDDDVRLGPRADLIELHGPPGAGTIDLGVGRDELELYDGSGADWTIDNRHGVITADGAGTPLTGAEAFSLEQARWATLSFTGGPAADVLDVSDPYTTAEPGPVTADLGGGDDRLVVREDLTGPYRGGPGVDDLVVEGLVLESAPLAERVEVDLSTGLVHAAGNPAARAMSFSRLALSNFDRSIVRLTNGADRLIVAGCRSVVHAGPGDDRIWLRDVDSHCDGPARSQRLRAYGESGDDRMEGAIGNDYLVGGPGRDAAFGSLGRDVCVAEKRRGCERA